MTIKKYQKVHTIIAYIFKLTVTFIITPTIYFYNYLIIRQKNLHRLQISLNLNLKFLQLYYYIIIWSKLRTKITISTSL